MLPTRILLDLDDVCNRFTMHALKQVGCPIDELAYRDFNPEWGWDIVAAANALHPTREFTPAEFWDSAQPGCLGECTRVVRVQDVASPL